MSDTETTVADGAADTKDLPSYNLGFDDLIAIIQRRARIVDNSLNGQFNPDWLLLHLEGMLNVAYLMRQAMVAQAEAATADTSKAN
jgi:hypothetical protein